MGHRKKRRGKRGRERRFTIHSHPYFYSPTWAEREKTEKGGKGRGGNPFGADADSVIAKAPYGTPILIFGVER